MSDRQTNLHADDTATWDAFVSDAHPGSYLQLSSWAQVKAVNG